MRRVRWSPDGLVSNVRHSDCLPGRPVRFPARSISPNGGQVSLARGELGSLGGLSLGWRGRWRRLGIRGLGRSWALTPGGCEIRRDAGGISREHLFELPFDAVELTVHIIGSQDV